MPTNKMKITIEGCKSKKKHKILEEAAQDFVLRLLSRRDVNKLDIRLEIKRKMDEDYLGCCYHLSKGRPSYFLIELLYNKDIYSMVSKLAHEMVHVKQYITGELKHKGSSISVWKGEVFDEKITDYWDLPWEIEAYGREVGLYTRYFNNQYLKY